MTAVKRMDEIKKYDVIDVDRVGEIDVYERSFLWNVIRQRELEIILNNVPHHPRLILDYGCGAGWLSAFLHRKGFDVVGVDIGVNLVKNAKRISPRTEFVVCDAEKLPFRGTAFDCIVGVAILHHLDLYESFKELKRVLDEKSKFVFMEPNSLNPLSAIGRKLFPTEAHTKGEKPFLPRYFKSVLSQTGFIFERYFTLFFFAFPLARLFKIANIRPCLSIIRFISLFESVIKSVPGIKQLNSTIVAVGRTYK